MPTPPEWPAKDPSEVLWYGFNWTPAKIGQSSIVSVVPTVTSGDVNVLDSEIGRVTGSRPEQGTMHLLSGGTNGVESTVRLVATTDDVPALTLVQSVSILVETQ